MNSQGRNKRDKNMGQSLRKEDVVRTKTDGLMERPSGCSGIGLVQGCRKMGIKTYVAVVKRSACNDVFYLTKLVMVPNPPKGRNNIGIN